MSDRQTLDVYNARVADYAKFADVSLPGAAIKRFIEALPPASRVLDLGCGPGVSSVHLRAAGHLPDPTDASEEMVKMAQEVHDLHLNCHIQRRGRLVQYQQFRA